MMNVGIYGKDRLGHIMAFERVGEGWFVHPSAWLGISCWNHSDHMRKWKRTVMTISEQVKLDVKVGMVDI